jgi:hypothetical protein
MYSKLTFNLYVAQVSSELTILLSQPSECWNYKNAPPHLANKYFLKWKQFLLIYVLRGYRNMQEVECVAAVERNLRRVGGE